jgi:hypothetical protein
MNFKEKAKDIGRHIIGEGDEVRFKNEVNEYAATHGMSREDAEKTIFSGKLGGLQHELAINGMIDGKSKDYQQLRAALNEMFGRDKLDKFMQDSADPKIFRAFAMPPSTPMEVNRQRMYYHRNFAGKTPAFGTLRDSADNTKLLDGVLRRFASDPRLRRGGSLDTILAANPDLAADLGKALSAKRLIEGHERGFGKDLNWEKATEQWKKTAEEAVTEMLWKAPKDCLTRVIKSGFASKNLGGFVEAFFKESMKCAGREMWAGSKLLAQSTHAAGSFIKNKVMR